MVCIIPKKQETIVSMGDYISSTQAIQIGVPEDSILECLLFLLHMNDLNKSIKNSRTYHIANDINILPSNESLEILAKK